MKTIVPIVEGPGDVTAVSELIRRVLVEKLHIWDIQVLQGMKLGRGKITDASSLKRHLRLASTVPDCVLIVVFADRDDDDCISLAEHIRACAKAEGLDHMAEALIINREYETWLLAGIESLRGKRGINEEASTPATLNSMRNPKKAITDAMEGSRAYSETADQTALTCVVDLEQISDRCSCFKKLVEKIGRHSQAA